MRERLSQWLESEYTPEMGTGVDREERIAKSLEYCAYHLWHIRQKLDDVAKIPESMAEIKSELANISGLITLYGPNERT